ncbi:hypothetical protein [Xanthomonas maliensis]|nr:hypothetical protein [Xanthomonas maliensis]
MEERLRRNAQRYSTDVSHRTITATRRCPAFTKVGKLSERGGPAAG